VSGDPVRLERGAADGLAELVIASAPLNLFDRALIDGLIEKLGDIAAEPPRALLIRAEGRVVSGGVNVELFDGLGPGEASTLWDELLGKIIEPIEALPAPVVFAAHGLTLTAAFEIALACDLIVAAQSARFGLVETVVGLTPSMGGTQRLAERAGSGRARELVMTGELFGAEQLERWDVVNRVYADDEFEQRSRELATTLAAGPTRAHAMTKHVVRRYVAGGVDAADEAIRRDAGELFATDDLKGAVKTFLERGPGHAEFDGR
jgi:enoyl-CoA hydratase/carnithine racemase